MQRPHAMLTILIYFVVTGVITAIFGVVAVLLMIADMKWVSSQLALTFRITTGTATAWIWVIVLISSAVFILTLSFFIGWFATRDLRIRLSSLAAAGAFYAAGKLSYRIDDQGDDDLSRTAAQLNNMAQRLEDQVAALQDAARDQLELRQQLQVDATRKERERVQRELHDTVSQDLLGMTLLASAAVAQGRKDEAKAMRLLPEIEALAKKTQMSMRALLLELRPTELRERDLQTALCALTAELQARSGIDISFTYVDTRSPDARVELLQTAQDALFLIAQEGLINTLKHALAKRIAIELTIELLRIVLRVKDDGVGAPESIVQNDGKFTSFGLRSMQERATLLGGSCLIRSDDSGVEVLAIIPLLQRGSDIG